MNFRCPGSIPWKFLGRIRAGECRTRQIPSAHATAQSVRTQMLVSQNERPEYHGVIYFCCLGSIVACQGSGSHQLQTVFFCVSSQVSAVWVRCPMMNHELNSGTCWPLPSCSRTAVPQNHVWNMLWSGVKQ